MTGIRIPRTLAVTLGVFSLGVLLLPLFGSGQKTVSVADCSYSVDPDRFLSREATSRRELNDRVSHLQKTFARSSQAPVSAVPAASIPQRNFIDQEIFGKLINQRVPSAALSGDTEFLRRISLDLTGRIPSAEDIRTFVADQSANKRDMVIEKLLNSAEFNDRWTMWLGDLLQNTATLNSVNFNRNIQGRNAFFSYIQNAIVTDKAFRDIATEVITAVGNNYDANTGAANFPMAGSTAMGPIQDTYDNMLVRTASTFLGLTYYDCLLCHNGRGHLDQISLWGSTGTRTDAQGMAAFFSRARFVRYPEPNPPVGQTASFYFASYEMQDAATGTYDLNTNYGNRPNRLPIGAVKSFTPAYRVTNAAPQGSGNWRFALAENLIKDPMFSRNLANRIWKQMFNLGVVDPVDTLDPARLDPANPPAAPWTLQATHPELLEKLARNFADGDFHLRPFLRTLVQSNAYQLSSRYEGNWSAEYIPLFARRYARRLEGEEVHDAITKATGIPGNYTVQYWADKVAWAMQLPEPVEPRSDGAANNFMNTFLRGNRDNSQRSQGGSIQQQLYLMNDAFVTNRTKVASSPRLKAIVAIGNADELLDELYLSFLSRYPTDYERLRANAVLAKATTSALRSNAVEDLAWVLINKAEFLFSY